MDNDEQKSSIEVAKEKGKEAFNKALQSETAQKGKEAFNKAMQSKTAQKGKEVFNKAMQSENAQKGKKLFNEGKAKFFALPKKIQYIVFGGCAVVFLIFMSRVFSKDSVPTQCSANICPPEIVLSGCSSKKIIAPARAPEAVQAWECKQKSQPGRLRTFLNLHPDTFLDVLNLFLGTAPIDFNGQVDG